MTFTDNEDGTALLTGKPGENNEGEHQIKLSITDNLISVPIVQEYTLEVIVIPNNPPVISSNPDTLVTADNLYEYIFEVSDADNDDLDITCTEKPE